MSKAVYAGSFDILTNGHLWMIQEGLRLFGSLTVAVGVNPSKTPTFSVEERLELIASVTEIEIGDLSIVSFEDKYLVKYAESVGAQYILRGIRNTNDYHFEEAMRVVNEDLSGKVRTVFLMPPQSLRKISSSTVKGLIGPDGWEEVVSLYVPAPVLGALIEKFD